MIRRPPRSTLFPTRRSSDLTRPDIMFLDIQMPQVDGFALLDQIGADARSEEHTSELQSRLHLVCRLLLEKKKIKTHRIDAIANSKIRITSNSIRAMHMVCPS